MHNDISEILFSEQDLAIRVRELGEAITRDYADVAGDAGIVVVSILRGGAVFTCDLIRAIDLPLEVDFMAVSSYGNGAKSSGVVRILKDLSTDIRGRHVVIAEDIIDSGLTLKYLLKNLQSREPASTQRTTMVMVIILLAVAFFVGSQFMRTGAMGTTVTDQLITSEFTQAVEQGRVKSVTYSAGDYTVSGTYFPAATAGAEAAGAFNGAFDSLNALMATEHGDDGKALGGVATTTLDPATLGKEHNYTSTYVGSDSLGELLAAHPDISYQVTLPSPFLEVLATLLPILIIGGLLMFFFYKMQQANNSQMSFGKNKAKKTLEERPDVTFADVAGVDEAVEEMQEIKDFLANPAKYQSMGAKIPRGCLLVGPPGTGKTLLARAVAGEAGVPFFSISGSDFVEMFVGVGASRVRDLFDQAKRAAPSIIFIDEIDAVGRHRGAGLGGGHDEREQTLNQLLVEMDGFAINEGVIVMAATNRRDILDPALLRPGRFDRTILVNYPDMAGRVAILKVHAKGKPLADDVDLENIAKRVPFSTGAELENIMNEAAILAARGRLKAINQQTLVEAISRVQMGPEKRSHKVTQRDKRMVAIHEAGHAIVGHVLPNCDEVHLITIVPRGQAGGYTLSLPTEEDDLQTYSQLMDFVAMGLGGHAAEQLYLGEFTTGATSDLKKATEVCRRMVTQFGMSEKLGPVYLDGDQEVFVGMEFGQSRGYSEEMAARIDAEVKRLLEECYQKAVDALSANRDRMEKLVDALLKYDTISRREFVTLMETGALPDIQDADTRTTGDVMMQDMADEKKKENSEKSAETPEKSAETPDKTADAPENHPDAPHEA